MSTNKDIAKSASIIGLFTLCSRILGFIRDVVIARMFGVYLYAQAFVIAFKIPNLLRDLVGEGAANAAFVPVLSEYNAKHTKEEFWELVNCLLNIMLVVLMSITILGILCAPVIVRLIAPGFISSPEKLETTIRLTRLLFPYIFLSGLAAYAMGILNSLKHFTICAFAPCLMNISIIICALLFGEGIVGLASGVLIGGFLQLAVQIPVLYKKGFRFAFLKRFKHPAAHMVGKLMAPRMVSSSIYQLNNFVDSIFGSLARIVGEGGVAVLYFSYRLIQFPLGIFSNALSQAILPEFSTQALEDTHDKLRYTLSWGLRCVFFVMLPASVAFMTLATPLIATLFAGNRFDGYSIQQTSSALFFYSIGLSSYGATKVLQSAFFALKDTVTPAKTALVALISNVILNALLMFPLKIGGIALATSISGINTFLILFLILRKKLGDFKTKEVFDSFARILLASLCMGIVCFFVSAKTAVLHKFFGLSFSIVSGLISYAIFCVIFRVREIDELWKWIKAKVVDKNQGFHDRRNKRTSCIAKEIKLLISDRIVMPDPDNDALTQAFNSITNKDEFVILEDATDPAGLTYLQVVVFDGNFTSLEYQEGTLDRHYNALEKNFTQKEIIETFLLYAKRDRQWKTRYNWEIDDASSFEKVSLMESEEARKYLENKHGNLKIEEVVFSKDIGDSMKKLILTKLHSYEEVEATQLLEMAQMEAKKAKLREVKTNITQKAQELYPRNNINEGRQPIAGEVKIFVWQRDGGKCVKCGRRENLEYDHIIPVSRGGSNTDRNIQLLCEKCNSEKYNNI